MKVGTSQSGSVGILEVVFVAIVLIFAGFVTWRINQVDKAVNDITVNTISASDNTIVPSNNSATRPAEGVEAPENVEKATLAAVGEYEGSGSATRSFTDDTFSHEVVASLDDPAEGKFYEGWLVGSSVVSTGKLTSEGGGEWSLTFTSEDDLTSHDSIFITEETEANGLDGNPEAHVLEGSF